LKSLPVYVKQAIVINFFAIIIRKAKFSLLLKMMTVFNEAQRKAFLYE
jgi:hypothetical protein